MHMPEAKKTASPVSTFESITGSFETNANVAESLVNRSRVLVQKIIGTEPQPEAETEKLLDAITLTDKLSTSAEKLRVSLNEIGDWLTKLEEAL